jgi:hypothetical protein
MFLEGVDNGRAAYFITVTASSSNRVSAAGGTPKGHHFLERRNAELCN